MTFEDLPYDHFAFKASHNTIDRAKDPRQWSIAQQLGGAGDAIEPVPALEFDLHQVPGLNVYHVKHDSGAEGPLLRDTLQEVVVWADGNPGHPVITIHLDLKNAPGDDFDFIHSFDEMLLSVLGEARIYRPGKVMGDQPDVVRGARAGGWATFRNLRGKVILVLTGNKHRRKERYADHEPRDRVCFADFAGDGLTPPRKGNQPFANLFVTHQTTRAELDPWVRAEGLVVRGYNLVARDSWHVCVDAGVNILSTDILDHPDFVVSGLGFAPLRTLPKEIRKDVEFGRARGGHRFHNWSRTVEFKPGRYVEPRTEEEIREIVRRGEGNTPIRTQGAGHSFSQILTTRGTLMSLDQLRIPTLGTRQYSRDGNRVTVPAGMRLKQLIPILRREGLGLANMGNVTPQSIAGAISTGTHGTGLRYPSMSTQVKAVRLIDGKGDFRAFDETTPELLGAARMSLGLLGILTSVTIEAVENYKVDYDAYLCDFEEAAEGIFPLAQENERVVLWWMLPILPRHKAIVVTKNRKGTGRGSLADAPPIADSALNKLNLQGNETVPRDGERLSEALGDEVHRSGFRHILHRSGGYEDMLTLPLLPVFHRELEYAIPAAKGGEALRAMDRIFAEGSAELNLGCEVRYVGGDGDLLSATQGEDVCYIGVSSLTNAVELFEQIEPVFRELGGRPHWGKHYNLTRKQLEEMYGDNLDRFREIRREMDPEGVFLNTLLERFFA